MARTYNGIGSIYYGITDERPDRTYITTLWIVFIFFPLIPVASFRVRNITSRQYQIIEKLPMNWKQIRRTYVIGLLFIIGIVIGIFAFFYGLDILTSYLEHKNRT
jgi:drug/metabolite transporter (DMT)-like permease